MTTDFTTSRHLLTLSSLISQTAIDNIKIEISTGRVSTLQAGVLEAKVIGAKTLTEPSVPEKRHLEIKLPS